MTTETADDAVEATSERKVLGVAPYAMGIFLVLVFLAGLMLSANAVDGYTYGAGLGFAAFVLCLATRYYSRLLPA